MKRHQYDHAAKIRKIISYATSYEILKFLLDKKQMDLFLQLHQQQNVTNEQKYDQTLKSNNLHNFTHHDWELVAEETEPKILHSFTTFMDEFWKGVICDLCYSLPATDNNRDYTEVYDLMFIFYNFTFSTNNPPSLYAI